MFVARCLRRTPRQLRFLATKSTTTTTSTTTTSSSATSPHLVTTDTTLSELAQIETTSLVDYLKMVISFRGPITVAEYINHALLHPEFGYYTQDQTKGGAVFGKDHDFTTAPEISQMFAELLGVWVVHTATNLGFDKFHLVEIGPGRGTLMEDVVRTISQFSQVADKLETIHLVEKSASLRTLQEEKVNWTDVQWHDNFSDIPGDVPCIVLAQELFDALPVHQFELTEHGWCERLVDILEVEEEEVDAEEEGGAPVVAASGPNAATGTDEAVEDTIDTKDTIDTIDTKDTNDTAEAEELRFVLSPAPTNASRVYVRMFDPIPILPDAEAPRSTDSASDAVEEEAESDSKEKVVDKDAIGSRLEVCPAGCALSQDIALRISTHGGAALFIDYGKDRASGDSLRGIKHHQFVSPLQSPGRVDLSVDVDFASLKAAAEALKIDGLNVYGTVGQGDFLKQLGIETRLHALLTQPGITEEQAETLYLAYHRLTDEEEMGTVYRAMSMVSMPTGGEYEESPPAGF